MSGAVAHLARRGFEAAMGSDDAPLRALMGERKGDGNVQVHVPAWGIIILVLTGLIFFFSIFVVSRNWAPQIRALQTDLLQIDQVYVRRGRCRPHCRRDSYPRCLRRR